MAFNGRDENTSLTYFSLRKEKEMREYIVDRVSGKTPPCKSAVSHEAVAGTFYTVKAEDLDDLYAKLNEETGYSIIVRKPFQQFVDYSAPKTEVEILDDWYD